eukprot:gene9253-10231_t
MSCLFDCCWCGRGSCKKGDYEIILLQPVDYDYEDTKEESLTNALEENFKSISEMKDFLNKDDNYIRNARFKHNNTILHMAILKAENENTDHRDFVKDLVCRGCNLKATNNANETPFLLAARHGKHSIIELIAAEKNNDINAKNQDGDTALHIAVKEEHAQCVSILHEFSYTYGLDKNMKNKFGLTPMDIARANDYKIDPKISQIFQMSEHQNTPTDVYRMQSIPRGICLIIGNENFPNKNYLKGCQSDVNQLRVRFQRLHFKVEEEMNLRASQMFMSLRNFAKRDHRKYDCSVVWIISHGCSGSVYGIDGSKLQINKILQLFSGISNAKSLVNKPKIFFIDACREYDLSEGCGQKSSISTTLPQVNESGYVNAMEYCEVSSDSEKPQHDRCDILVCYSCPDGYLSWREPDTGPSWFITAVCDVLDNYADKEDFDCLMKRVNRELSKRGVVSSTKQFLQVSALEGHLMKQFWLSPKTQFKIKSQQLRHGWALQQQGCGEMNDTWFVSDDSSSTNSQEENVVQEQPIGATAEPQLSKKDLLINALKEKSIDIDKIMSLIEENESLINVEDKKHNTLLHLAVLKVGNEDEKHIELVKFLMSKGANMKAQNKGGDTPFLLAARCGKYSFLELFSKHPDNEINAKDKEDNTALHLSVMENQKECVALLHKFSNTLGMKENVKNKVGSTPIDIAKSNDYDVRPEILDILQLDEVVEQVQQCSISQSASNSSIVDSDSRREANSPVVQHIHNYHIDAKPGSTVYAGENIFHKSATDKDEEKVASGEDETFSTQVTSVQDEEYSTQATPGEGETFSIQATSGEDERFPIQEISEEDEKSSYQLPSDPNECYAMDSNPRGVLLIFANETFSKESGLPDRNGCQDDVKQLRDTFTTLYFEVEVEENLQKTEMLKILKEFANRDHSQFDCSVVCILSHGCAGAVYGVNKGKLSINEILKLFSCAETLKDKPKLFFINACREYEPKKVAKDGSDVVEMDGFEQIHDRCDTFVGYSVPDVGLDSMNTDGHFKCSIFVETGTQRENVNKVFFNPRLIRAFFLNTGYPSWRIENGMSWYIGILCDVFNRHGQNMEFQRLMLKVNDAVSKMKAKIKDGELALQIPCPENALRRQLWFKTPPPS